jgi:hypothetical protein
MGTPRLACLTANGIEGILKEEGCSSSRISQNVTKDRPSGQSVIALVSLKAERLGLMMAIEIKI